MLQAHDDITLGLNGYRLLAPLGLSAYGAVWRARGADGLDVALKFINREQMLQAAPALHGRWIDSASKEIAFLRSLAPWDERHIVRLIDSGCHDGLPVMALELMDSDLARGHAQLDGAADGAGRLARILGWIGHVNQALAKVHQYGWLYLDLKPANVLLTAGGEARLADFGASRLRSAGAPLHYSGTASWQAPEQFFPASGGVYQTCERTDYFALGALLYYLVTGGAQLRFCQACGDAWRRYQHNAAATLRAAGGHASPLTLHEDEAALFADCIAAFDDDAVQPGLTLLRALLCPDSRGRPQHSLQISRMLAAMRPAGVHRMTPPVRGAMACAGSRA